MVYYDQVSTPQNVEEAPWQDGDLAEDTDTEEKFDG